MHFLRFLWPKSSKYTRDSHQTSPTSLPGEQTTSGHPARSNLTQATRTSTRLNRVAWAGLKSFLDSLNKGVGGAGPLKSAVGDLVEITGICDAIARGRHDYEQLSVELDSLFSEINGYHELWGQILWTQSTAAEIEQISDQIKLVIEVVHKKQQRGLMIRIYAHTEDDIQDVINCYRRIQAIVQKLQRTLSKLTIQMLINDRKNNLFNRLHFVAEALYNSSEVRFLGRRTCTPGTRKGVLAALKDWSEDSSREAVYCVNGMAGTGKTTITQTFCAQLQSSGRLGASFFCSNALPKCRNVDRIIPTISYQLAQSSSEFALELSRVLEINNESQLQGLEAQFQKLFLQPLQYASERHPLDLVIVIDALDECEYQGGAGLLLKMIISQQNLPIKILITSRPEPVVRSSLESKDSQARFGACHLHNLDENLVKCDIRIFFEEELRFMPIPLTKNQFDTLVERSNTLFIYAATAVRYIQARNFSMSPEKRLELVLSGLAITSKAKDMEMDNLYTRILGPAFADPALESWDIDDRKFVLHTVLCANEPLTIPALMDILQMTSKQVESALDPLWSVLNVPLPDSDNKFVTVLHASFREFVFRCQNSDIFYCDKRKHQQYLARRCLTMIQDINPRFNICGLESSYIPDDKVPCLLERIEKNISPGLVYACLNWPSHLEGAGDIGMCDQFEDFFRSSLLVWMEILTLKKSIGFGPQALRRAQQWNKQYKCNSMLINLIQDSYNFVTMFAHSPARHSTPHIYISMLALWPRDSPIFVIYSPHFRRLIGSRGNTILNHEPRVLSRWSMSGVVSSLAMSHNGAYIVAGTTNGDISVWDSQSRRIVFGPFKIHKDAITSVAYAPNAAQIASCSLSARLFTQDSQTGQIALGPLEGHAKRVNTIMYSPDSKLLITGSDDGTIRTWSSSNGKTTSVFAGHKAPVLSIACAYTHTQGNGYFVISGSADRTVFILDIHNSVIRVVFGPLNGHNSPVTALACSPDGLCAVSGSADGAIYIWDMLTGNALAKCPKSHLSTISQISFSPSGSYFASCSIDSTIYTWDPARGELRDGPLKTRSFALDALSYSPYGDQIISCSKDGSVQVWGTTQAKKEAVGVGGHSAQVNSIDFCPDGIRIVSGSHDRTLCIWSAYTGRILMGPLEGHSGAVQVVAYSHDGLSIVSGSADKTLIIWASRTGEVKIGPLKGHDSIVFSAAFFPDDSRIISGSADHSVHIWSTYTGQLLTKIHNQNSWVYSVACSRDGSLFAFGTVNQTAHIYNASEFGAILTLKSDDRACPVLSLTFSPDGGYIISGSDDGVICRWNVGTGELTVWPVAESDSSIRAVTYSPNGKYVASGSEDGIICILDAQTGDVVAGPLSGHNDSILSVVYSPDSTYLASGSADGSVRIWDIDRLKKRSKFKPGGLQRLTEDGWVVDDSFNHLVWIPHDLRDRLSLEDEVLQIAIQGSFSLDISNACLGDLWRNIYCVD